MRAILGIFSIIVIWAVLSYSKLINPLFIATPTQTLVALFSLENLFSDIWISILRTIGGFLLAVLIGIPLGIIIGAYKSAERFIESMVNTLRYIPVAAFIPLSILWFGIDNIQKIFIICIGVLPYIILYTASAASNVEKEYLEAAHTLRIKNKLLRVILPRSLPKIYDVCRIEMAGAWALTILVEVVAANEGLGHRLVLAQRFLQTPNLFALLVIVGIIGLCIDFAFKSNFSKLFPWEQKSLQNV